MSPENLIASDGEITPEVVTSISSESRLVTSSTLVDSILYLTLVTGEKLASRRRTLTSSSLSFNSSIPTYQTFFSILISISRFSPSLSISVI